MSQRKIMKTFIALKKRKKNMYSIMKTLLILGFHSCDETAMLVYKTMAMAQVLHNNRIKFPTDIFALVLYSNMAAVISRENRE